jgi:hypothetical protein
MKRYLFLSFLLLTGTIVLAQETLPQSLNRVSVQTAGNNPLFIVKLEGKSFEIRSDETKSPENFLKEIDPNWIESIEVFKDEKAKERFGDKGYAGVVVVDLKKESINKMPVEFSNRFK